MISTAQTALKNTIAHSATFQAMVGAVDAEAAKAKVFEDALPKPAGDSYTKTEYSNLRPFVIIGFSDDVESFTFVKTAQGGGAAECFRSTGNFRCDFQRNYPEGTNPADAQKGFRDQMSGIIEDMANLAETENMLAIIRFGLMGPFRVAEEQPNNLGDHMWATLSVDYGFQA